MLRNSPGRSGRNGGKRKLHNEIKNLNTEITQLSIAKESTNKVQPIDNKSVFDLPAINNNEKYWFDHSDQYPSECFIDTDGIEHYTGIICVLL